ncbi:hypothetical protein OJ997_29335 [Solirubrobacter phytolaccae]|uniref:Uncharacterized protein n=1 Tax=Solirubrobacter phytolaccae TaxID=1404360 RepID=A0A9X3SAG6_9ACTN|nr:hypothetical protein [Solirubrobacter phytolaccae]MDA0184444.1 hypothetical protein [Solirubrobacter phytolaccae]
MCSTSAHAADVLRVGLREDAHGLLAGPDGGAYVQVDRATGKTDVARVLPDGRIVLARGYDFLHGGALGADGGAWYGVSDRLRALRVDPAGAAHVQLLTEPGFVAPLTSGADGTVWATTGDEQRFATMAPDGRVTEVPSGHDAICDAPAFQPFAMTRAADGAIWATGGCRRVTRNAVAYELAASGEDVAPDPTGGVWVRLFGPVPGIVSHITADGQLVDVELPRALGSPDDIAAAPDGSAWLTFGRCTLARVTVDGRVGVVASPIPAREVAFDGTGTVWLANRARVTRGLEGTCDGSAPRVRVPKRISLGALRRGIPVTVAGRAQVTAYTSANVKRQGFSPTPTIRTLARGGTFRARVQLYERRQVKAGTRIFVVVAVTDDEGNERSSEFRVRVTR